MNNGDRLGPYELLSPLGEGGMGGVWKARLNRSVAIKVSKSTFSDSFEREARAIAAHGKLRRSFRQNSSLKKQLL